MVLNHMAYDLIVNICLIILLYKCIFEVLFDDLDKGHRLKNATLQKSTLLYKCCCIFNLQNHGNNHNSDLWESFCSSPHVFLSQENI